MGSIQNFFLFCSGVERSILEKCPSDTNKYAGIGATIFFTGVLAFFSSAYALYTVFDSVFMAIVFGLVWGAMIFNLDRYIVMSMKSRGSWWWDAFVALPRIALAVLLALVISKPLELKIFEKEINGELVKMEQEVYKAQEDLAGERYTGQLAEIAAQRDALKAEINQKTEIRNALVAAAVAEADGTGGSQKRNMGPIYRAKKAEADNATSELLALQAENTPKINAFEAELAALTGERQTTISNLERSKYDGMAARMEALSRLSTDSQAILWASLFITLLFISIETAPIFVKLISSRSPYDYLLHQHEQVFEMEHLKETTLRKNVVTNNLRVETEIGTHALQAKITAEKAKIDADLKQKLDGLRRNGSAAVDW